MNSAKYSYPTRGQEPNDQTKNREQLDTNKFVVKSVEIPVVTVWLHVKTDQSCAKVFF